ncbi:MAG: TonB-dependent receptor, partial [Thermodesulfobacteriota bacterium]
MRVLILIFAALFFVAALWLVPIATAAEPVQIAALDDMDEMEELLAILDEETEIATKTKMNADYVPGIVTVLHGEDMEALGARTVWEALSFVPGVDATINNEGNYLALVRGIGFDLHIGHLKILINSAPANLSTEGGNRTLMLIPIEQVERIEVIRGTGAAIYGEYSYAGVINIITRKDGNRVYGSGASFDTYGGGGHLSYHNPARDFDVSLSISGWTSDGADVNSGPDMLALSANPITAAASLSPGATNEDEKVAMAAFNLSYKKFKLDLFGAFTDHGQYFGVNVLQGDSDASPVETTYWSAEASQRVSLTPTLEAGLKGHISEGETKVEYLMIIPPGAALPPPPGPPVPPVYIPFGLFVGPHIKERRLEGTVDFKWTGLKKHIWTLTLSHAEAKIVDAYQESNFFGGVNYPVPIRVPDAMSGMMPSGVDRGISGAVLQDQFELTKDITVTGAIRYDHYDDVGGAVTPRLAAVWHIGEPHILKIQYARGFRPPTLADLHYPVLAQGKRGNPNLEPEWIDTYEAGYIFRRAGTVVRGTAYYSKLTDMVLHGPGRAPINGSDARLCGVELEFEQQLTRNWKILSNVSFMEAYNDSADSEIVGSTNLLGNFAVMGKIMKNLLVTARYRH